MKTSHKNVKLKQSGAGGKAGKAAPKASKPDSKAFRMAQKEDAGKI